MLKKIPNFADGMQIAIVSERRLLWFHSGIFWQQTAVSCIPLHAVFVELQSQKWAGASHVRWIQLCNSLRNNVCVWNSASNFGKRLWKYLNHWSKFTERNSMSYTQCYEWFNIFKEGRTSVSEDPGLDELPHQQMTAILREFMRWFVEILVWQSERLLRRWAPV